MKKKEEVTQDVESTQASEAPEAQEETPKVKKGRFRFGRKKQEAEESVENPAEATEAADEEAGEEEQKPGFHPFQARNYKKRQLEVLNLECQSRILNAKQSRAEKEAELQARFDAGEINEDEFKAENELIAESYFEEEKAVEEYRAERLLEIKEKTEEVKKFGDDSGLSERWTIDSASEMGSVAVRLQDLNKTFTDKTGRKTVAVNDFTVTIPAGKLVGLLGPSGCGKSTTLFMIAGLHKPTSGRIFFGDDDVTLMPPERRGIGLVFQNYALYPHMTVRQNIVFPLENMKMPKHEAAELAQKMAELVHIGDLMDRYPQQLSGGQQQRVAIARALVKKPRVLLLDEPLSNLDARLRLQMREEIRRIQTRTEITTVFVTHDQEEAMSISDKIVLMNFGLFQQEDEPQKVYDDPKNLFVAKFLGNPPINVQAGYIQKGKLYLNNGTFLQNMKADDQEVFIGIRPEFFKIDPKGAIEAEVKIVEHIGRDSMAICDLINADTIAPRETLRIAPLPEEEPQEAVEPETGEPDAAAEAPEITEVAEAVEQAVPETRGRHQVEVAFFTDGGSEIPSVYVDKGQPVAQPEFIPVKRGQSFRGWLLNGRVYNFEDPVNEDIVLEAQWEKNSIRIIINEQRDKLAVDAKVKLGYKKIFVFNAESGERIL